MFDTKEPIETYIKQDDSHGDNISVVVDKEEGQDFHDLTIGITEMLMEELDFIKSQGWTLCCIAKNLDDKQLIDIHFVETTLRKVKQ